MVGVDEQARYGYPHEVTPVVDNKVSWGLAGGSATILVFVAGLFIKVQVDLSAVNQRESDDIERIDELIVSSKERIDQDRSDRISIELEYSKRVDQIATFISQRIDQINDRLGEVQRQTSAIEGKLGENVPNKR